MRTRTILVISLATLAATQLPANATPKEGTACALLMLDSPDKSNLDDARRAMGESWSGDAACLAEAALVFAGHHMCDDAVKVADRAVSFAPADPTPRLARGLAAECVLSVEQSANLTGGPLSCASSRVEEILRDLVQGALLGSHPDAPRFTLAAIERLARVCVDEDRAVLAVAATIRARFPSTASEALATYADFAGLAVDVPQSRVPAGMTGGAWLADAQAALKGKPRTSLPTLRTGVRWWLEQALRIDPACINDIHGGCPIVAETLLAASGEAAGHSPSHLGQLIDDLRFVARAGGLRVPRLLQHAATLPLWSVNTQPSPALRAAYSELLTLATPERSHIAGALLATKLELLLAIDTKNAPCDRARLILSTISRFGGSAGQAPVTQWGRLILGGAIAGLRSTERCSEATVAAEYFRHIHDSLSANPPEMPYPETIVIQDVK